MPKYITSVRNLPIRTMRGKSDYVQVNAPGTPQMDFDPNSIELKIEAGVSYEIQKNKALAILQGLMKASPKFAAFMSTEQGLETMLDNIDMRGIDTLKAEVAAFCKQADDMAQKNAAMSPQAIKMGELQVKKQQIESDTQLSAARISVEKQDSDTKRMLAMSEVGVQESEQQLKAAQVQAENSRTAVDYAVKHADIQHKHTMDLLELHHTNERHTKTLESNEEQNETENQPAMQSMQNV